MKKGLLHRLLPVYLFFHTLQLELVNLSTGKKTMNYIHQKHQPVCITKYELEFLTASKQWVYVPHPQTSTLSSHHSSQQRPQHTTSPLMSLHPPPQPTSLSIPPAPTPLLWHWYCYSPTWLHPTAVTTMPPTPSYLHTLLACQIPSGSPEASCQAHTPFLATAILQMYFKGHVFSPLFPICLPAFQPFLGCPQRFCFFQEHFHFLLSPKPVWALHD